MKPFWLSAFAAMIVAAIVAAPSEAQKGKGGGGGGGGRGGAKGGSLTPPAKSSAQHTGPGHSELGRAFDHPNSGNNLSKESHDKSTPGRHETPEKQPGAAHHLQKSDDAKTHVDPSKHPSKPAPTTDPKTARPFDHPKSGNSLPQDVKDKLPPGLRDKPDNHPGLANHLRKMGILNDHPAVDPIPPSVRSQLPPGLRDRPYDHPGVANHLGKLGWSINDDGALVPPTNWTPPALTPSALTPRALTPQGFTPQGFTPQGFTPQALLKPSTLTPLGLTPPNLTPPATTPPALTPPTPNATPFDAFQPFGGFFRRR